MIVLSWVAAFVCCLGYGIGSVLQSIGARRTAGDGGLSGIARIVVQLPYLAGLATDGVAFIANVVAARALPLFLVQSIMAGSIGVTAIIVAVRGARTRVRDWLCLVALCAGLVLLAICARPGVAKPVPTATPWLVLLSCVLPLIIGAVVWRMSGRAAWIGLSLASGTGFAIVAVAARGMGALRVDWALLLSPYVWAIIIGGVLALGCFAAALQRGPVTAVTAVSFSLELIVPSILGLLIFGDQVAAGRDTLAAAGFALTVIGTVLLARFAQ